MSIQVEKEINQISKNLTDIFVEWLMCGGHSIKGKQGQIILSKNGKRGVIYSDKNSKNCRLNDYLIERFKLFSQQWLKHGKPFIDELKMSLAARYRRALGQFELRKVA